MCGICGQFNFLDGAPVARANIEQMTRSLAHRGPDDEGVYVSGPLGLGFRRLSIIDLQGGHQPMSDDIRSVWVVFNGEIYNFCELRRELEDSGHVFQTSSDTEVVVHGYKQWGHEVLTRLKGMFGIAIWDAKNQKLILARDAMGIKLIYYRIEEGAVYFGSEARAVAKGRSCLDPTALNLFLRYRYTPSPFTLFEGVQKLAPGSMAVFENGTYRIQRWYNFNPTPSHSIRSLDEAEEGLLELYKASVKRHLVSDVPVGLLLSGGVDSGLLLGLMTLYGNVWPTYTVGYGNSFRDDELDDAAETARIFSSKHISVRLERNTFEDNLSRIISSLEEPVASSSIVPMYFVCQRASQDVKVALIGQGPDELFGGYTRHLGLYYGELWRSLPTWIRNPLSGALGVLPRNESIKRGLYSLDMPSRMSRYQHVFSIMPGDSIDQIFLDGIVPKGSGDKILGCWEDLRAVVEQCDELGGFQFLEVRSALPDELLMYADKLSMAHGLEARVPFLDRDIVEYAQRLPSNLKVRHGGQKWLHKRVSAKFLPKTITRRKKKGFAVNVVDDWFRDSMSGKMHGAFMDSASKMYRYLNSTAVQRLFIDHVAGRSDNHKILFSLVVFEEWLRCNDVH
ncbi:MAG: asparagine synthase (glutamine-hydrolyzing) [Nitrospira sp.]|nr:asparagine synthase (glutamine-hydrolyzing) [Nitrospira sp.]